VKVSSSASLTYIKCINFAYLAQLTGVVGSGLLAQSVQKLLGGPNESTWLSQGITILTVVLSPPIGQCADLWGRKWPLVGAMICGCVGAIVASRAQTMGTAIAGFCVMGISYGAQPLLHAVVSEVLPRKQRPIAQATVNASAGLGGFLGVCIGGSLLKDGVLENYRIYLYINAGIFLAAAAGLALLYNPPRRELQTVLSTTEKLRSLHWISYFLFTSGLVLFCLSLSWSRNPYPWSDPRVTATFAIGVVLMIGFAVYETRFKSNGILNHQLFKNRNFPLALLTIFAEGLAFFSFNAYFAFEIGVKTQSNLLMSALPLGIFFLSSMVFAYLAGFYSSKRRQLRLPLVAGFTMILLFFVVMAATFADNIQPAYWGLAVILGAGTGVILPLTMVAAQLSTPADLISITSALVIATRSLGGTVGLAINNALFNSALATELPRKIAGATIPLGLPSTSIPDLIAGLTSQNPTLLGEVPGASPSIIQAAAAALVQAYSVGFRDCWIAATCFMFVAVVGE
jgi:MFS family permease